MDRAKYSFLSPEKQLTAIRVEETLVVTISYNVGQVTMQSALWIHSLHQEPHVEILSPRKVTVFGNRIFKEMSKVT